MVYQSVLVMPGTLLDPKYPAYLGRTGRADERTRTADLLITSELLYLLSYVGLYGVEYIARIWGFHVIWLTRIRDRSSL